MFALRPICDFSEGSSQPTPGEALLYQNSNKSYRMSSVQQATKKRATPKQRSVLIVDDAVYYRRLLATLLRGMNFTTLMAENGYEASRTLRERDVDLVLTDIMMPVWDGYQLCRWIRSRSLPKFRQLPVIMCSSRTDKSTVDQALVVGSDGFVEKPLKLKQLEDKIQNALTRATF